MYRFVSLLLIPLCLLGQPGLLGQPLPHSHDGSGVTEPDGHSERPHIHFAIGVVHDHDASHHHHEQGDSADFDNDDDLSIAEMTFTCMDHEQDAIYLVNLASDRRIQVSRVSVELVAVSGNWLTLPSLIHASPLQNCCVHPPDRYGGPPFCICIASLQI